MIHIPVLGSVVGHKSSQHDEKGRALSAFARPQLLCYRTPAVFLSLALLLFLMDQTRSCLQDTTQGLTPCCSPHVWRI